MTKKATKAAKTTRTTKTKQASATNPPEPILMGGRLWWPTRLSVSNGNDGATINVDGFAYAHYGIFKKPGQGDQEAPCIYLADVRAACILHVFDSLPAAAAGAQVDEAIENLTVGGDMDIATCSFTLANKMFPDLGFVDTGRIDLAEQSPVWRLPPIEEMRDLP